MIAFDPPDAAWARRARLSLLGVDFCGRDAIFTPLAPTYRRLAKSINAPGRDGWWTVSADADVLVAHVPQGSPMLDGLYALQAGTQITFVGLAGSLRGDPVGTVVEPLTSSIVWPGNAPDADRGLERAARAHPAALVGTPGHIVSVGCLAQSTQQHSDLMRWADWVDFETGPLLAAAAACGQRARSVLVISDSNFQGDVFGSDPAEIRDTLERVCGEVISSPPSGRNDSD